MNPNKAPSKKHTPTPHDVNEGKKVIREAIWNWEQCFWPQILIRNKGRVPVEALSQASQEMQRSGEIRLREDDMEHDWEFLLVRKRDES